MSIRPRSCHVPRGSAVLFGLFTVFLHLPADPAMAQTPAEMVRSFADTVCGFTLMAEVDEGALRVDRQRGFSVEFQEGVEYLVVGFCDDNCTHLDLGLLNPSGEEIRPEGLSEVQPVLIVTPDITGRYQVTVDMVGCSVEPCVYAAGVLKEEPKEEPGESSTSWD